MNNHLSEKNVLVTDSTKGTGASIVRKLHADGAKVIIHYTDNKEIAESLLSEIDGCGWIIHADLSKAEGAFSLWKDSIKVAGEIHALVNNASTRTEISVNSTPEEWRTIFQREFQMNFFSTADLSKEAILHFKTIGGGKIINITSRAGQRGYTADALPYGCSKAALINLTKSIARSFGTEGVIAISIAPGWVDSEISENSISVEAKRQALDEIPIREMVTPEELADLVAFVLKPSQISLNGSTLDINGGSYIR